MATNVKIGDTIKVINMDDNNGKDPSARAYNGRVGTVELIDGIGQIHCKEFGLAINPEIDEFIVL